jgi:Na+/melibiose symporter-like transporter
MSPVDDSPVPLSRRQLALYAGPCLGLAGVALPLGALLPAYYAEVLGLNLSAVGVTFMAVRLADIGLDPVLGVLMDRTRTSWGRFRPWLAAGAPVMMIATVLLFFARPGVGPLYLAAGLLVAYGGWSICVLAQSAWGALLSTDYHERSRIYSWWQAFNLIGLLLVILAPILAARFGLDSRRDNMEVMGALLVLLYPLTIGLAVVHAPEPEPAVDRRPARLADWAALFRLDAVRRIMLVDLILGLGFGVQTSLFLFYFEAFKGIAPLKANLLLLVYFLAGLGGGPVWTALARRIDKHRALAVSCLFYLLGLLGLYLMPFGSVPWAGAAALVAGLPYSASNLLSRSMMADAGDEETLDSGEDRTGLLYAVLNSSTKVGSALAVGATFVSLDLVGFQPAGGHNAPGALIGLALLFLAFPAALNLMGAGLLLGYPLTAGRYAQIRLALDRPRS